MPAQDKNQRNRGIAANVLNPSVNPAGTPMLDAASFKNSAQSSPLVIPGSITIGNQVSYMPASTAVADALIGAAEGLSEFHKAWETSQRQASQEAFSTLKAKYYEQSLKSPEPSDMDSWLESQGFVPDKYNRESFAEFRAAVSGKARDQWESDDLVNEIANFFGEIAKDPTGMNNTGQRLYLSKRADQSGNSKFIRWSSGKISELNQSTANTALAVNKLLQQNEWDKSWNMVASDNVAMSTLASMPSKLAVTQGIMTGLFSWNKEQSAFMTPDNKLIDPTIDESVVESMLAVYNPGIMTDPAMLESLIKTSNSNSDMAAKYAKQMDVGLRDLAAKSATERSAYLSLDEFARIMSESPTMDVAQMHPGDTERDLETKRIAWDSHLESLIGTHAQALFESKPEEPIQSKIDRVKGSLTIPRLPQYSHLLDEKGNPNERGRSVLNRSATILGNLALDYLSKDSVAELKLITESAKSGSPNPSQMQEAANAVALRMLMPVGGSELSEGYVKFPKVDSSTPSGMAVLRVREAYSEASTEISKSGMLLNTITNPASVSTGKLNDAIDTIIENESHVIEPISRFITTNNGNVFSALSSAEYFGNLLRSHGRFNPATPKAVEYVSSLFDDPTNYRAILMGTSILSATEGTEAYNSILPKLKPLQRQLAYASLDEYRSMAFKSRMSDIASMNVNGDQKAAELQSQMADNALNEFTTDTRELINNLSSQDASTIMAVSSRIRNLGDPAASSYNRRTDPMLMGFYDAVVPSVASAIEENGNAVINGSGMETLMALSDDPETAPIVEEMLARAFVLTKSGEMTPARWKQVVGMAMGSPQRFYQSNRVMHRLFDPDRHFSEDLPDRLDFAWNAPMELLNAEGLEKVNSIKDAWLDTILERNPSAKLHRNSELDEFVNAYAKSVYPDWLNGDTSARLVLSDNEDIQSFVMDSMSPGVPLQIEIMDKSGPITRIPVVSTHGNSPLLILSQRWLTARGPTRQIDKTDDEEPMRPIPHGVDFTQMNW